MRNLSKYCHYDRLIADVNLVDLKQGVLWVPFVKIFPGRKILT